MHTKFPYDTIRRVTILNSDTNSGTEFIVYTKQIEQLAQLVNEAGSASPDSSFMPGVEPAAVMGMDVIFDFIPQKFPVQNLLEWLRDSINPNLTLSVVESALSKLALHYEDDKKGGLL